MLFGAPSEREDGSAMLERDPKATDVWRHFDASAEEFDSIYTGRKSALSRWLDRTFRKDMFGRFEETIREIKKMGAVSVLDVGCGSGLFSVALAGEGVKSACGVDFSQTMINLAVRRAGEAGVSTKCHFIVGDFRLVQFNEPFHCCIAIGVFDYLAQPKPFLKRMREFTRQKLIATFPCRWTYRAPIRKARLLAHGCPVYFYSASDVRGLFAPLNPSRLAIRKIGHIFFAVAEFQ